MVICHVCSEFIMTPFMEWRSLSQGSLWSQEGKVPAGLYLTATQSLGEHIFPGSPPCSHILTIHLCIFNTGTIPGELFTNLSWQHSSELHHTGCALVHNGPLSPTSFRDLRDLLSPAEPCPVGHMYLAGGPL